MLTMLKSFLMFIIHVINNREILLTDRNQSESVTFTKII